MCVCVSAPENPDPEPGCGCWVLLVPEGRSALEVLLGLRYGSVPFLLFIQLHFGDLPSSS